MSGLKVVLVHDWLTGMRGGERCLEEFLRIYPDADVLTMIHVPGTTSELIDRNVKQTSLLQCLPGVKFYYRWLLPLYPFAIKSLNTEGYDLVISLSHAAAKNIKIHSGSEHICYCFTPMRYIWDQAESYFGKLRFLLAPILYLLRVWDRQGARGVDRFVAISRFVGARIRSFYKTNADVIYPPIADHWLAEGSIEEKEIKENNAFLYAGALVPYKNVEEIINAFKDTKDKLIIAGDGPLKEKLQAISTDNVEFIGRVSDAELRRLYASSRALIFAAKEDFGLIPIECLAAGTPVIAPHCGALKESLKNFKYWKFKDFKADNFTGVFYRYNVDNLAEEIQNGLRFFKEIETDINHSFCHQHAEEFSVASFRQQWFELIDELDIKARVNA